MKPTTGRSLSLMALALVALLVCTWSFLFRSVRSDNPSLGELTTIYRWGRPSAVLLDTNRDGVVDMKGRVGPRWTKAGIPLETWESTKCDGIFDLHLEYELTGDVKLLEFDRDRDGHFEEVFNHEQAHDFLAGMEGLRATSCKAT